MIHIKCREDYTKQRKPDIFFEKRSLSGRISTRKAKKSVLAND